MDLLGYIVVSDCANHAIRRISPSALVSTIAGGASIGYANGFGSDALLNFPTGISAVGLSGAYQVADGNRIRQLTCVPCPVSFFVESGNNTPRRCPAGSFCPYIYTSLTCPTSPELCPKGSFSNAGATNCTLCPAGTFAPATGSTSCQQCPGGHFCPAGTSSWARLNCGRGNYCPDGSGTPTPCPYQVPPTGGWGALQVQGPAFLVETSHCLNHCFWNFTSGDGVLSKC